MERRAFLGAAGRAALVVAAAGLLPGHTPYRQWVVYRKRHLMILASKRDPEGYAKCRGLAERLAAAIPESRARPSRAANAERIQCKYRPEPLDNDQVFRLGNTVVIEQHRSLLEAPRKLVAGVALGRRRTGDGWGCRGGTSFRPQSSRSSFRPK